MSFSLSSFLFDYISFSGLLFDLSKEIEDGHVEKVDQLVQDLRKDVGEDIKKWIFHGRGTSLGNIGLDSEPQYKNALLGHWLLIILSQFLSDPANLGYHWTSLSATLLSVGWTEKAVHEALFGMPISYLIETDMSFSEKRQLQWSDPFLYWIRPERSVYSGWLSLERISIYHGRLSDSYRILLNKPSLIITQPVGSYPTNQELAKNKQQEVIHLITQIIDRHAYAERKRVGLYTICY